MKRFSEAVNEPLLTEAQVRCLNVFIGGVKGWESPTTGIVLCVTLFVGGPGRDGQACDKPHTSPLRVQYYVGVCGSSGKDEMQLLREPIFVYLPTHDILIR